MTPRTSPGASSASNENLCARNSRTAHPGRKRRLHQNDVTAFAQIITGWSIGGGKGRLAGGAPGRFYFRDNLHEPGAKTFMGKTYHESESAAGRGRAADLARQRATARFIATKLVRHFVADDPPPAAVERVAHAFLKGGGDLPTVYAALIEAPEAWDADMRKFKNTGRLRVLDLGGRSMCRRASRRKSCTASTSWVSVNIRGIACRLAGHLEELGWVGCPHAPRVVGLSGPQAATSRASTRWISRHPVSAPMYAPRR